jgi:diguanylate cyclase (GGDEF)-like protein
VGRKIGLAAAAMIPLVAIISALGLHSTTYLEDSRADVERTLTILRQMEGLDAALHRADGHELEFLIDGKADHRDAFIAALAEADAHYSAAVRLARDPSAVASLGRLRDDVAALGNEFQAEVAVYDIGGAAAAQARRKAGPEPALERQVVETTTSVVHREEQLLVARDRTAAGRARTMRVALVSGALLLCLVALALGAVLTRHLNRRLRLVVDAARSVAGGDLTARAPGLGADEIGLLASAVNDMAASLEAALLRSEEESGRARFARRLSVALERADDEAAIAAVAARAMAHMGAGTPTELLVADSSTAHLHRLASHPTAGAPGCGVVSPWNCPAVRAGRSLVFASSGDLDSCPHLTARSSSASAMCVPITSMGRAFGVLHTTGPDGRPPAEQTAEELEVVAAAVGARLGSVRTAAEVEGQARTDGLTGFLNRRTIENELRTLVSSGAPFALAMIDLDKFKTLNDTYGHEAGDRALRIFAEAVRATVRTNDLVGRWGGEEFVLALPGGNVPQLLEALARLRGELAEAVGRAGAPVFTASFGATDSTAAASIEELMRLADAALLDAKAQGRDRVVVAEAGATPAPPGV